jgi:hypothetical protein
MEQTVKQSDRDAWPSVVGSLLQLTQKGSLEWHPVPLDASPVGGDIPAGSHVEQVLTARYKNWTLRLYHILRKKSGLTPLIMGLVDDSDASDWITSAALQVLDADGKTVMTIPPMRMLRDLLRAIQYRNRPKSLESADLFVREVLGESLTTGPK